MSDLKKKIDFVVLVSVTNANSNGDPLNGNRPRTDYNGYGEISDVCIKRKIRNRMQDMGNSVFVQSDDKEIDADRLQLCAQGIALEEMLVCSIAYGFLYYKETNRREKVDFTEQLRKDTISMSKEMNHYYQRGWTPKVKSKQKCKSCSLYEICLPNLEKRNNVSAYIDEYIKE